MANPFQALGNGGSAIYNQYLTNHTDYVTFFEALPDIDQTNKTPPPIGLAEGGEQLFRKVLHHPHGTTFLDLDIYVKALPKPLQLKTDYRIRVIRWDNGVEITAGSGKSIEEATQKLYKKLFNLENV